MKTLLISLIVICPLMLAAQKTVADKPVAPTSVSKKPVRIGIAGLTHDHVNWIFNSARENKDFVIVGIAEPNRELAERYAKRYNFGMDLVYPSLAEMLDGARP